MHYPTDSSLRWDCYRVPSRLNSRVREYDAEAVGSRRLQDRRVERLMLHITRQANNKGVNRRKLDRPYRALLAHTSRILDWSGEVRTQFRERLETAGYDLQIGLILTGILRQMDDDAPLTEKVIARASRRILKGERVPNAEKLFSIFEPHTE